MISAQLSTSLVLALALCSVALGGLAPRAEAAIESATVIEGPGSGVLEVDGAAMAPDGTGGIVFRKLLDGAPHVFVSRFQDGHFEAPIQVDVGQTGPATMPAIAAGEDGRLLVVWVQPWASESSGNGQTPTTHYQLMSALLAPGAQSFGAAMEVDPKDVGNGTAAYPSLAMAPNGTAYVVYRVVTYAFSPLEPAPSNTIEPTRPGDVLMEVRAARFNGEWWSSLGSINGLPLGDVTMRRPTASNAPQIAVDKSGEAVVVWQEPTIEGVARVYARRLFDTTKGNVLEVSPHTLDGKPVTAEAEAPALSMGAFGGAGVAFRLDAGQPLGTPQVFVDALPAAAAKDASQFTGAKDVDGAAGIGTPSVSFEEAEESYSVSFTAGGQTQLVTGDNKGVGTPIALGPTDAETALTTLDPSGGDADAWLASDGGGSVVQARESFGEGGWQTANLAGPLSGPIDGLAVGPSSLGDALVGFEQGSEQYAQVLGAVIKAPPGKFTASAPPSWVTGPDATITWEPAPNAIGTVTYELLVDGQVEQRGLTGSGTHLSTRGLGDGKHEIQVLATDADGQHTLSNKSVLLVDDTPPLVTMHKLSPTRVRVTVSDDASGVKTRATVIEFGDGTKVRGKADATHAYGKPSHYVIVVRSEDNAGKRGVARIRVQIR